MDENRYHKQNNQWLARFYQIEMQNFNKLLLILVLKKPIWGALMGMLYSIE